MLWREKLKSLFNTFTYMKQERGAIFVLTALMLPVLFGFLGIGYDVGNLYMHKARLQHAADAAALAGARAFVDENATKRKQYRDEYKSSNHVTTIPADARENINQNAKADAKVAAKAAAVANVNQNMVNLHNNAYQSSYYLVTGIIHEAGKDYNQQYFKVNLKETVPLFFLPVIMNKKEQDVAAEAVSTIIRQEGGNNNNNNNDNNNGGIESLFMVKSSFTIGGGWHHGADGTPSSQKGGHHPTWSGYYDGDLRYTGNSPSVDFGNGGTDPYDGTNFEVLFNSKGTALLNAIRGLEGLSHKDVETIENSNEFAIFITELKKNKYYFTKEGETGTLTEAGENFISEIKQRLSQDDGYAHAYNYFYEMVRSNSYYHSKFTHIDYDMDSFGDSVESLFKNKLAKLRNTADDKIPEYLEDKAAWDAANNNLTEEQLNAAYNTMVEKANAAKKTPKELYTILVEYHNRMVGLWTVPDDVWDDYVTAGSPGGIPKDSFASLIGGNWSDSGKNHESWEENLGSWQWDNIKGFYKETIKIPTKDEYKTDLLRVATGGLTHEPVPSEYKPAASDTYYAQYNGGERPWKASELSTSNILSKEHSYFCYNGSANIINFTIDKDGFYTGNGIGSDDPFYFFVAKDVNDVINIKLEADMNRPLVFCYMGTNSPKIYLQLNGHTFRGVIYTPNHSNGHMNSSGGTFKGTWMGEGITLQQGNAHFEYVDYELEESLEKAWPGYSEESSGGDNGQNQEDYGDDETDNSWIKVIKLVNSVDNVKEVEDL